MAVLQDPVQPLETPPRRPVEPVAPLDPAPEPAPGEPTTDDDDRTEPRTPK